MDAAAKSCSAGRARLLAEHGGCPGRGDGSARPHPCPVPIPALSPSPSAHGVCARAAVLRQATPLTPCPPSSPSKGKFHVPLTAVTGSVARCPWRQRGLTRQLPSRRGRAGGRSCSPPRPRRTLARPARAAPAAPLPPGWDAACPCCFVVPGLQTADFKRNATAHLDTIFSPFLLLTQVCVGGCLPAAAPQRRG